MKPVIVAILLLIAGAAVLRSVATCAKGDHWARIEALARKDNGKGNAELVKYLRSLSRDEMLAAARQCAENVQKTRSPSEWGPASVGVALALTFYPEPFDLGR